MGLGEKKLHLQVRVTTDLLRYIFTTSGLPDKCRGNVFEGFLVFDETFYLFYVFDETFFFYVLTKLFCFLRF